MIEYLEVVLGVGDFKYFFFFFFFFFFFLFLDDGMGRESLYLGYTFWYEVGSENTFWNWAGDQKA